jgi:hypothetical protein
MWNPPLFFRVGPYNLIFKDEWLNGQLWRIVCVIINNKLVILTLLIGLLIIAVVAVVALLFVDPAVFRGQLEARASAAFGRQFQIDGPISLERSLRPRIVIEDISIGNPAWASGKHFAKVEKIGVQVAGFGYFVYRSGGVYRRGPRWC